jgi:hypothetical protein
MHDNARSYVGYGRIDWEKLGGSRVDLVVKAGGAD